MSERTYTPPVLRVICDNIAARGNPLGLAGKDCIEWAEGLDIPRTGDTILYTGAEYQMASRIDALVELLKRVKPGDAALSTFRGIQSVARKIGVDLAKPLDRLAGDRIVAYNGLLQKAAAILIRLEVPFACLEDEPYSGALLYELGLFEEFADQAKHVVAHFRKAGVRQVIALTPHSAEVFEKVYPRFVHGFDIEVTPYVSIVAEAVRRQDRPLWLRRPLTVTLHDPCHLARTLEITEHPREVLEAIENLELREAEWNRQLTHCCGAPCETVLPEITEMVASRRVEGLSATKAEATVTLCPFCHASLSRSVASEGAGLRVIDFVEIVYEAVEGDHATP